MGGRGKPYLLSLPTSVKEEIADLEYRRPATKLRSDGHKGNVLHSFLQHTDHSPIIGICQPGHILTLRFSNSYLMAKKSFFKLLS